MIRAVLVLILGKVTGCDPSFGVLASRVVGKVCPSSVDRRMSTFAQLTGAAVLLATFQVMVCDEFGEYGPPRLNT